MSYDIPDLRMYEFGQDATFGSASVAHFVVGPRGKTGVVREISCEVTTSLVGSTTVPEIMIGISSGDFTYGRYRLGTATGTGYGLGAYNASNELITGNPPRALADFASHVVLDGGPLTTGGIAGGTFIGTVLQGKIPASGAKIVNVVNGTGNACRCTLSDPLPPSLVTGQLVNVRGVQGATGANVFQTAISALNVAGNWIELSGTTFGGTYTGGGIVDFVVAITGKAGTGGSPAGGGFIRAAIEWVGPTNP